MSGRNTSFAFIGIDKFSKVADKVSDKAGHMGKKFGVAGKAIGVAAGGIATGLGLAAIASVKMAEAAAQDQKAQVQLARTLKNTTGATRAQVAQVEDYIAKTGLATGVTDDQMRPALARLARSTGDVGEAQSLLQVAMDISAATGRDLGSVSGALARAHDGQSGALSRLGIKTKDASGKALEFDQVLKNAARTFQGSAAAGAQTMDGKMARLRLRFDETKEAIGARLLPVFEKVADWVLSKGIPMFQRWGEQIMPKVREVMDKVRKAVDDNRPSLDQLGRIVVAVGTFVGTKLIPAWLKFVGFVLPLVVKAIAGVGKILPPIVTAYLTGAATIVGGFRRLHTGVTTVLTGILATADRTMGWIPGIGTKIHNAKLAFDRFKDGTGAALAKTEADLRSAAGKVRDFGKNVNALKSKNVTISATVRVGNVTITRAALAKLERYMNQGGMGGVGPTSGGPPSGPSAGLMSATRGVGHPGAVFMQRGPRWSWNRRNGLGMHDGADITGTGYGAKVYAPRGGRFLGRLRGGWHGNATQWSHKGAVLTYAHMSRFGGTMPGGIIGYTGSTGNSSGPHLHIQARRNGTYVNPAAYLASGGIVRRRPGGTVIVAGEGQHDEAVVPLDGRRMGGDTYEIHVHGGFDSNAAREMQRALMDLQRRTGRPLFPAAS